MQKAKGVIYAVKRSLQEKFTDDDLELASAIAMLTGVSIQGLEALDQHKKFLLDMVKTLVAATEMRDASARGHSRRVAAISGAIADVMKIPPERKERVELAGLLHDIGKIGVSEYGLHSVGQIQDDIRGGKLAHHVIMGEKIISRMPELADIAEAVKTHHEAWDGSGYPRGLKRDQIPLMGRIVAAANAFEQLLSRGGQAGDSMSIKKALMQIGKLASRKYDPEVVKALLIAHRNGSLSFDTGPEDL
jgi:putative nucleotidyltransferase with HDIG domain